MLKYKLQVYFANLTTSIFSHEWQNFGYTSQEHINGNKTQKTAMQKLDINNWLNVCRILKWSKLQLYIFINILDHITVAFQWEEFQGNPPKANYRLTDGQ